ncbi:alkylphosphonate utilization protein, partial [Citrobacter sp. AAK_AS5]
QKEAEESAKTRDVNGNELQDGDMLTIIKDLKFKCVSVPLKVGTKAKIRLVDGPNGHNLESKFDGIGKLYIKNEYVKKILLYLSLIFFYF